MLKVSIAFFLVFCLRGYHEKSFAESLINESKNSFFSDLGLNPKHYPLPLDTVVNSLNKAELEMKGQKFSPLGLFLSDLSIYLRVNTSELGFSNFHRDVSYLRGLGFGIQETLPLGRKTLFLVGVQYDQRGFYQADPDVRFVNRYIDFPLAVSFELPELRKVDFRFYLGGQFSMKLGSKQYGNYPQGYNLMFDSNEFNSTDGGFIFGISAERHKFFFRAGSYIGFRKLIPYDTGAPNSFGLDLGYFLFRSLKK
jgi:hypothetical protein